MVDIEIIRKQLKALLDGWAYELYQDSGLTTSDAMIDKMVDEILGIVTQDCE